MQRILGMVRVVRGDGPAQAAALDLMRYRIEGASVAAGLPLGGAAIHI